MDKNIDFEKEDLADRLRGSLLDFMKMFYPILTKRDFIVSRPICRESHHITICRAYTELFRVQKPAHGLMINLPPGYGKSLMTSLWVAWCYAHYGDCNFLYISYSHDLAAKHTSFIKQIMTSKEYQYLFGVTIRMDSRAKDHFVTNQGGTIAAFGAQGSITGRDGGNIGLSRFSGAVVIDDAMKPDEATSATIRESVVRNYQETILQRPRDTNVPILFIGQRLHEDDLPAYMLSGKDVRKWQTVILKGIDDAGNALYPEAQSLEYLRELQEKQPYVFSSQIQQEPIPAGGALFKPEWFVTLDEEPEILFSFLTADTAETTKTHNDATVFSFWGIYEIENFGNKTGELGLHWIDCLEIRVEPKDLKEAFVDFYANCGRHKVPPLTAFIEKKSTGVTLVSVLNEIRGISIRALERTKASGSKTQRFLEIQPYIASKCISFSKYAKHMHMCVTHLSKITANDAHKHDDICFIADTKIATPYGDKNIQDIKVGDKVITPFGIGEVEVAGLTKHSAEVITRHGLTGTLNHPVFADGEFKPLLTLTDAARVSSLTLKELLKWKYQKLLSSMESLTDLWGRNAIISAKQKSLKSEKVLRDFMSQSGSFIASRQYQKAMLFITKMATTLITTMTTWSVYRISNIWLSIGKPKLTTQPQSKTNHPVYNIKVQGYGVYYANGILVSNCDTLSDAVKLALIDKTVYSLERRDENKSSFLQEMSQGIDSKIIAGKHRHHGNSEQTY